MIGLSRGAFIEWAKGTRENALSRVKQMEDIINKNKNHLDLPVVYKERLFQKGAATAFLQCLRMLGVNKEDINKAREGSDVARIEDRQ